jgi:hypothetical protein
LQAVNRLAMPPPVSAPSVPPSALPGRALVAVPEAGERTVVERPPPGLGRGARTGSSIAVFALTAAIVLVFVTYYVVRFRKRNQ